LKTLEKVAEAMDCELVYYFKPKNFSSFNDLISHLFSMQTDSKNQNVPIKNEQLEKQLIDKLKKYVDKKEI
jgi:hypothetical protein